MGSIQQGIDFLVGTRSTRPAVVLEDAIPPMPGLNHADMKHGDSHKIEFTTYLMLHFSKQHRKRAVHANTETISNFRNLICFYTAIAEYVLYLTHS